MAPVDLIFFRVIAFLKLKYLFEKIEFSRYKLYRRPIDSYNDMVYFGGIK